MHNRLIREIPLIERYSRHNEAEDWRFRAYLNKSSMADDELDGIVRETTDTVWAQLDCTKCANCCRTMEVTLDCADIERLSKHLGMTVRQFTAGYVAENKESGKSFKASPCRFLGADNRCTVYEHRPQACRDFPYLHADGFRSRGMTMISNCSTCPIVFNVWHALKERLWIRRRDPR